MNYISKETIENKLKSLESSYYINLADLIITKLFDENSIYSRNKLKELAKEINKIKNYCKREDIKINFNEKNGILDFLRIELRFINKKIEDLNLQLNMLDKVSILYKIKASNIRTKISKEFYKHSTLTNYIDNFDTNYNRDIFMLKSYFIDLESDLDTGLNDDFVKIKLEIEVIHHDGNIKIKTVKGL